MPVSSAPLCLSIDDVDPVIDGLDKSFAGVGI